MERSDYYRINGMISLDDIGHTYDSSDMFDKLFMEINYKGSKKGRSAGGSTEGYAGGYMGGYMGGELDDIPHEIFTDAITEEDIEELRKESVGVNNKIGGDDRVYTSKENDQIINLINEIFHEDIRNKPSKTTEKKPTRSLVSKNPVIVAPNPLLVEDPQEDLMYNEKDIQFTLFPTWRELTSESPEGEDMEFYREWVAMQPVIKGFDDNDDLFRIDDQLASDERSKSIDYFIVKMETDSDQMKKLFRSPIIEENPNLSD
jgi:hypothetical protein